MPTGVFPRTPEHITALRAGLQKWVENGGKPGRPVGSKRAPSLAVALEQYDKAEATLHAAEATLRAAETALRAAVARAVTEGAADSELVRRAVGIVTR